MKLHGAGSPLSSNGFANALAILGVDAPTLHPDLSNPVPGGYLGGAAEYGRLNGASTLDADAALQSASWGIGQLMGFNYGVIGYASVQQMVEAMGDDEDEQLQATATFIEASAMNEALRRHDWQDFARSYNGSDFGRVGYDVKLAAAYARYRQWLPNLDLRSVQVALVYLGFSPGPIDGIMGPRTAAAIMAFQRKRKLKATGRLDAQMTDTLLDAAFAA
jgi:hypothetical protein